MVVSNLDFMPLKRTILPQIRNSWNDTPLTIEGAEIVTAKQVLDLAATGVPIIDARVAAEYDEAHIANAISVPYVEKSKKETNFNPAADYFDMSKLPTDKKAAVVAIKAGYPKVYWLRGGIPEWQEKSYPVASSRTTKAFVASK